MSRISLPRYVTSQLVASCPLSLTLSLTLSSLPPSQWLALLPVHWSPTRLMVGALLRTSLVLPILLTVSPSPTHPIIHPGTLGWAVFFVFLLGLSNGYLGSLPMIVFSREVKRPEHREMAGESQQIVSPVRSNTVSCCPCQGLS